MATTVAISDVVSRAAYVLGIAAENVTPATAITTDLTNAYNEVYAELEADQLTRWASSEAVPNKFASSMVDLVAYARKDYYPLSDSRYMRVSMAAGQDGETARNRIRKLNATTWSNEIVPGEYW